MNPADDDLTEPQGEPEEYVPTPEQVKSAWLEIEDIMCGRVARARDIMKALMMSGVPISNDTVVGLRMVADQLQDLILNIE